MKFSVAHLFLVFSIVCITVCSCSKDTASDNKFCWQVIDAQGTLLNTECDKTPEEMSATHPNPCTYYKNEARYCWLVNNSDFYPEISAEGLKVIMTCFRGMPTYTSQVVPCNYCLKWYHRLKRTYKPNSTITYSEIIREQFCGDTAQKLFQGRQIIQKDTPDSLVVLQFSNDGGHW